MSTPASQSEASLLKNVLIMTPLSLIGRAGTLLIYVVLANWFGDPAEMDFIYYYWGIAVFLIELLSAASAYSVLVPMLAEARAKGEIEAQQCVQSIFSRYILFMPGLCCLLVLLSWVISQFFLPSAGLPASTTIGIVGGFLCFAIIAAARWMLKAILDTYQAFHLPVIVQGLRAILVIGVIYLCKPFLMWLSIPLALIIGELFQLIVLFRRCCAVLNLPVRHLKLQLAENIVHDAIPAAMSADDGRSDLRRIKPGRRQRHGEFIGSKFRLEIRLRAPPVRNP